MEQKESQFKPATKCIRGESLIKLKTVTLLVVLSGILLIGAKYQFSRNLWKGNANIEDVVQQTSELIYGIEKYKQKKGAYPKNLKLLIPDYFPKEPVIESRYYFHKVHYYQLLVEGKEGFGLKVFKKGFVMLGDRRSDFLEYNSNKQYESNKHRVLHKVVNDWGVYTTYRIYRPDRHKK